MVDKGDNKYSKVPCKIVNLNDVDSEITLIQANAQTRELSDADKLKQIERLTELYKEKKKNGEKVTNIRKLVSKDIGLSEGQVAKYSTVSNNLIPELRTILDEGNLSISNATEFSSLSEENQKIILDIINKRVDISRNEAVEIKKQLKEIELEKNRIIEREKQKSEEILKLKSENETKSIEIDTKIEQVKKEILENSNKEKEELIKKLNSLEDDKKKLENEKEELENSIKNSNESTKEEIEHEVNQRLEEIKSQFEKDNLKLKEENKKLKEKINKNNNLDEKQILNQELKIRLNNTIRDISRVAGLMANNTIIDEDTLSLVKKLKNELRFLNEQTELYSSQQKF